MSGPELLQSVLYSVVAPVGLFLGIWGTRDSRRKLTLLFACVIVIAMASLGGWVDWVQRAPNWDKEWHVSFFFSPVAPAGFFAAMI